MKTKTRITLTVLALALMFAIMPMILGEDTNDSQFSEADIELNESVSGGTILGQQIKLWFTINKEKKMTQELKLARLRLIQANIAMKNNNTLAMEKALEAHERIMNRVEGQMTKYKDGSRFEELNNSAVKLVGLQRAIQVHEIRIAFIQEKLQNTNLTEQQRQVLENRLEKAQNNTANLIQVNEDKKEQIKTRLMAVGNLTEEQAQSLVDSREEQIQQRVENRIEQRQQARAEIRNQTLSA